jgi:opacity protein-like surface antigen
MKKVHSSLMMLAAVVSISSVHCYGESLRNTDYISVEAGAFTYGDKVMDDIFGTHVDLFGSVNKRLNQNVAALGKLEGIYGEGSSAGIDLTHYGLKGGLSLVYLVSPEKSAADPYILAGGLVEYNQVEGSAGGESASKDETEVGFEIGGGIEFDLGSKTFGDVGLLYQNIGEFDSLTPNARLGYAFSEKLTGLLSVGYALDEEDYWLRLGLGVKL